ncbi:MAG: S1-like domain-containing RNA-binding protein [Tidjanibacter sp.]|nr:S1-like domain-containing RNA-binding protein [Tidjanibacter sp.]
MLIVGEYQKLKVARIADHGLYLSDDEENEVLLPNRYVSMADKVDDEVEVFVYHDTENRLIATRERPLVTVGHAAYLKAVDRNVHGLFFDWGITAKDLFMPNVNSAGQVEIGRKYILYAYLDKASGRVVATQRLNAFVSNSSITVHEKEQVEILVARRTESGFRVIIEDRHWGMLYDNQVFTSVRVGDRMMAYVRRITDDNRIDLALSQEGFDEVRATADRLKELLQAAGGTLHLSDSSSPDEIMQTVHTSKKSFKRAVGHLLKEGIVEISDDTITLRR